MITHVLIHLSRDSVQCASLNDFDLASQHLRPCYEVLHHLLTGYSFSNFFEYEKRALNMVLTGFTTFIRQVVIHHWTRSKDVNPTCCTRGKKWLITNQVSFHWLF